MAMIRPMGIALMLCISIVRPLGARDFNGFFYVFGEGNSSCGSWLAEKGTAMEHLDLSWVLGFITAFNAYGLFVDKDVALGTNSDGLAAWIDNYCRAHPRENIAKAAERLIAEFRARSGAR